MEKLYIIIPAYNEASNIEELVSEWINVVSNVSPESRLLIVNDGSRDNTLEILHRLKQEYIQLEIEDKPNGGHGSTIYYGYQRAIEAGADYVFQTDSDRQTLPEEFSQFWKVRKNFDACIGVRSHRQDGSSRVIVTSVLRLALFLVFGLNIKDANTPFRLMRHDVLRDALALVPPNHNLTNVMLSIVLSAQKRNIAWLPITFRPRQGGVNSINLRRISRIGLKAVQDFWAFRKTLRQNGL
ncbi:glycosyltransferase family 2 protein [Desulfovibrio inopinatus]|uniref:glycosyltransferase family 2 protein n=1 Tax=Desulfovibrio inopinatus TaxID=102109 RepID=UPI000418FB80|nr:glycosyltransferase family 2 protein [Desulfovibrio inopinatus]